MKSELKIEFNKILSYINDNYEEPTIVTPDFKNYPYHILIPTKQYDVEITLEEPEEDHYLYGKCKYVLRFDFNANKKYRNELNWHGGGGSEEYNFKNIDEFLKDFCTRKPYKQMTIFD